MTAPARPAPAAPEIAPAEDAPSAGTCLGFDFGTRRIGVAVGDAALGTARPLAAVAVRGDGPDWAAIDALVAEWAPVALVVGLPLTADGEAQPITAHARGFLRRLARRTALPAFPADERYSSIGAAEAIASARADGRRRRRAAKGDVDAAAAALILERWFAGERLDERLDGRAEERPGGRP